MYLCMAIFVLFALSEMKYLLFLHKKVQRFISLSKKSIEIINNCFISSKEKSIRIDAS